MNKQDYFKRNKILVIGDIMLDSYFMGAVDRISPEAPVPVFKKLTQRSVLGGAANVAVNLVAAGQDVALLSVIGNDSKGDFLLSLLTGAHINSQFVIKTPRLTTEKVRLIANGHQQVLRLDIEDVKDINSQEENLLLQMLNGKIQDFDLVVVSDYMKGLLTTSFLQKLISLVNSAKVRVLIDVKDTNAVKYSNAYLLKPNLKELAGLTKMPVNTEEEIIAASEKLRTITNSCFVLTTCGDQGMQLIGDHIRYKIQADSHEVFDVTGAGDTAIAYLAAALANKFAIQDAVNIANRAAGIQVSKMGTSVVQLCEVFK